MADHGRPWHPAAYVGFKAYMSHAATLAWFQRAAALVDTGRGRGVEIGFMPSATALAVVAARAKECRIMLGAQDCSTMPSGPFTGEIPATLLAEIGVSFVEVGHPERRRLGDTDETVAAKTVAAVEAGLTPFVCAGEHHRVVPDRAATEVVDQLDRALDSVADHSRVVLAYEPRWAIGADQPAPVEHIVAVLARVRAWTTFRGRLTLLYGGAAGPGLYSEISGVADGLALGRRVHDVEAFGAVLDEMQAARGNTGESVP